MQCGGLAKHNYCKVRSDSGADNTLCIVMHGRVYPVSRHSLRCESDLVRRKSVTSMHHHFAQAPCSTCRDVVTMIYYILHTTYYIVVHEWGIARFIFRVCLQVYLERAFAQIAKHVLKYFTFTKKYYLVMG